VRSVEEMRQIGSEIASHLQGGEIIVVRGPLGAGKTALTQGIGAALGIEGITSPTFVISRIHEGKIKLNHVDAYRLLGVEKGLFQFDDLDLETEGAVTVIEWGEEIVERLSDEYLVISIEFGREENERILTSIPHGPRWRGFSL
jgi:tRNA threonylcarbamoyladenosine biosynthesis protein TsaE